MSANEPRSSASASRASGGWRQTASYRRPRTQESFGADIPRTSRGGAQAGENHLTCDNSAQFIAVRAGIDWHRWQRVHCYTRGADDWWWTRAPLALAFESAGPPQLCNERGVRPVVREPGREGEPALGDVWGPFAPSAARNLNRCPGIGASGGEPPRDARPFTTMIDRRGIGAGGQMSRGASGGAAPYDHRMIEAEDAGLCSPNAAAGSMRAFSLVEPDRRFTEWRRVTSRGAAYGHDSVRASPLESARAVPVTLPPGARLENDCS